MSTRMRQMTMKVHAAAVGVAMVLRAGGTVTVGFLGRELQQQELMLLKLLRMKKQELLQRELLE